MKKKLFMKINENYFCIFGKNNFSINCYSLSGIYIVDVQSISFSINHEGNEGKCFYLGKNNYYELRKNVLKELAHGFSSIHDNFKYFKTLNKHKVKIVGAAEWLLDNIYLIEKEYKCVKKSMPLEYFKSLPYGSDYLKYIEDDMIIVRKNIIKIQTTDQTKKILIVI